MRKKLKVMLVTAIVLVMISVTPVFGANDITVYKDGNQIEFDAPIYIKDGNTMVPMRSIAEAMGCLVVWSDTYKSVQVFGDGGALDEINITMYFILGNSTVQYTATNKEMEWNHEEINENISIGTAPEIVNGRVMLPLRFLAENLGFNVEWDNVTKRIDISKNNYFRFELKKRNNQSPDGSLDMHYDDPYYRALNEEYMRLENQKHEQNNNQYIHIFENSEDESSSPEAFQ